MLVFNAFFLFLLHPGIMDTDSRLSLSKLSACAFFTSKVQKTLLVSWHQVVEVFTVESLKPCLSLGYKLQMGNTGNVKPFLFTSFSLFLLCWCS